MSTAIADAQTYQAQRRRPEELAELDRAKTEFFTGVRHELRTPLTLITGPAEDSLADTQDPPSPGQRARVELVRDRAGLGGGAGRPAPSPGERGQRPRGGLDVHRDATGSARTGTAPADTRAFSAVRHYREEALQWSDTDRSDAPATAPVDVGPTAGATVLVAEDNPDLRRFIARLLEPHYRVLLAGDGRSAPEQAQVDHPDLVLTDVMMPDLDGFELLTALRTDRTTAAIPVILLSARAGEEATGQGLAAGSDDYLVKPFSSADLLARIRSNLTLARPRTPESAWRSALISAMQDGMSVADSDGTIVEVNDAFADIVGYGAKDLPVHRRTRGGLTRCRRRLLEGLHHPSHRPGTKPDKLTPLVPG